MRARWWWPVVLVLAGCVSSPAPDPDQPGVVDRGRSWVLYRGPELVATVGFNDARRHLGDPWLILAAELSGAHGNPTVFREAISVRTPDGRQLPLISQDGFRAGYGAHRMRIERALADLPRLLRFDDLQRPCDRWFLAGPFESFAFDRVYLNPFAACTGPLVFEVPGGLQPGRWRLLVELEESRADIPFELGDDD